MKLNGDWNAKYTIQLKLKITGYNDILTFFLKKLNPYHGIKKKRPALNIEDNKELLQHCKQ